jgi:mRNA interferase RelE/StbE
VPPNPACRSLSRQDFKYRYYKPLTRPALPEHSCRWQLWIGPLRRSHLGQKHVLYALVDPVSAPSATHQSLQVHGSRRDCPSELMVEPPGTAPGSDRFITTPVYRHSRPLRDGTPNIGGEGLRRKGGFVRLSAQPRAWTDRRREEAGERHEPGAVRSGIELHLRNEPKKTSRSRIKRLRGITRPQHRLRIAEVRVFYDVSASAVEILAVAAKSEAESWVTQFASRA